MLSGTQLDFAYNTLDMDNMMDDSMFAPAKSAPMKRVEPPPKQHMANNTVESLLPKGIPVKDVIPSSPMSNDNAEKQKHYYDTTSFNKQFEQQQQMNAYLRQMTLASQAQPIQQIQQQHQQQESGYFDRLFSKKKDFLKLAQWILIIVLAISVHFFVEHYLKAYISTSDFSPEREMFIRALYPIGILFILWNLRVFSKP